MSDFLKLDLGSIEDGRGSLSVIEDALPFIIRRVFWVSRADGQIRGGHRHHITRQALVAVAGCVEVNLDDGVHTGVVVLDEPSQCLLVEPEDWHTMQFGPGAVLLVMASHKYDAADYITESYRTRRPR